MNPKDIAQNVMLACPLRPHPEDPTIAGLISLIRFSDSGIDQREMALACTKTAISAWLAADPSASCVKKMDRTNEMGIGKASAQVSLRVIVGWVGNPPFGFWF